MSLGKSIRIFLADGSVSGIRHAEVVNWTGQAIACARSRIGELKSWAEVTRPGVYFLFGQEDGASAATAYIGEAEAVLARLPRHLREKDFWNEIVMFTSKDEHLTKSHVKYLESRLLALATEAGRYSLDNDNASTAPRLPRGDIDAMEEFIAHIRVLLGALGHRLLEPMLGAAPPSSEPAVTDGVVLHLRQRDIEATMQVAEDGFVVKRGSKAAAEHIHANYRQLRERLIADGILARSGELFAFTRDHLFSSSSAAAAVVVGSVRNGREVWKDARGRTLKDIEEASSSLLEQ